MNERIWGIIGGVALLLALLSPNVIYIKNRARCVNAPISALHQYAIAVQLKSFGKRG